MKRQNAKIWDDEEVREDPDAPMSLDDKMQKLRDCNPSSTLEAKALAKKVLSKKDHSSLWQKAKIQMRANPQLAKDYAEAGTKAAKSNVLLAFNLDPGMEGLYRSASASVSTAQRLLRTEAWNSWTAMGTKFSDAEIQAHIKSGRILERECPDTGGVWEHQDTKDLVKTSAATKEKAMKGEQKVDVVDEEELNLSKACITHVFLGSHRKVSISKEAGTLAARAKAKECLWLSQQGKAKARATNLFLPLGPSPKMK